MSALSFVESVVEDAALAWLGELGYTVLHGPEIAPDTPRAERDDYGQAVLERRLRLALFRLNPDLPPEAREEAFRKLTRADAPTLEGRNHQVHRLLVDGVTVEYRRPDGSIAGAQARVLDYAEPERNEWLAVNQFTVLENKQNRRADIVLFVNGLPLGVIELKNPADEKATVWAAFKQLQTYKQQIPSLFTYNEALLVSDGVLARLGTLTANREWFLPWRTITGEDLASPGLPELQVMLEGAFDRRRFLDAHDRPGIHPRGAADAEGRDDEPRFLLMNIVDEPFEPPLDILGGRVVAVGVGTLDEQDIRILRHVIIAQDRLAGLSQIAGEQQAADMA